VRYTGTVNYQRYTSYRRPYLQQPKPKKKRSKLLPLAVLALLIVGAFFMFGGGDTKLPSIIKKEPKPEKVRVEGRYLFNGTVVWARHMQTWSAKPDGTTNYAYPFSGLNTFDRSKYDAWTADLECPVMAEEISVERQVSDTAFNCRPEFLPEAAKYFDFFNLANNHTRDFNDQAALDETRTQLERAGIQHWGDFEPGKTNNICEVMALPVRIISKVGDKETSAKGDLPVAFCAWHYFFRLPLDGEIEHMQQYADVLPTFAFIQAGIEYRASADQYQRMMARRAADLKPSFVVVNSAHWVQNGEVYNGVPILYSTGNFIFDQQYNAEVMRSASLDGSMTIDYTPELDKWLALGASCKIQKDDCLAQITAQGLKKPTLSFKYDLVAGDNSNKLTKKADATVQAAVEERVGWAAIKAALGQ
jgi:hypothetical protein